MGHCIHLRWLNTTWKQHLKRQNFLRIKLSYSEALSRPYISSHLLEWEGRRLKSRGISKHPRNLEEMSEIHSLLCRITFYAYKVDSASCYILSDVNVFGNLWYTVTCMHICFTLLITLQYFAPSLLRTLAAFWFASFGLSGQTIRLFIICTCVSSSILHWMTSHSTKQGCSLPFQNKWSRRIWSV